MKRTLSLRLLSHFVIVYMLLAFTWWSVLLYIKNKDAFTAKSEHIKMVMINEHKIVNSEDFHKTIEYQSLAREYKGQEWMILGEAIVFVFSLVLAIWFINRGYNKEMNAARQRRNFLLSITHELKSPIASIKLILQTFQKRELLKEQKVKLTNSAIKEADRLNNLVNDLLLAAKIETTYQLNIEEFDLSNLIENLIKGLKVKFQNDHFDFNSNPKNIMFEGDKLGITSLVLNLLENAVKYSKNPAQIAISLDQNDKNINLKIADQGIGIAEEEKKKIFNQFYRIGSENTRETKGTGLGLFIVKEVVKAHHGSIKVLDNQPSGSIFRILLPLTTEG
jgi:two-component system, OmpR family, phosphate regulon sensor histidine kinase PhoR